MQIKWVWLLHVVSANCCQTFWKLAAQQAIVSYMTVVYSCASRWAKWLLTALMRWWHHSHHPEIQEWPKTQEPLSMVPISKVALCVASKQTAHNHNHLWLNVPDSWVQHHRVEAVLFLSFRKKLNVCSWCGVLVCVWGVKVCVYALTSGNFIPNSLRTVATMDSERMPESSLPSNLVGCFHFSKSCPPCFSSSHEIFVIPFYDWYTVCGMHRAHSTHCRHVHTCALTHTRCLFLNILMIHRE